VRTKKKRKKKKGKKEREKKRDGSTGGLNFWGDDRYIDIQGLCGRLPPG
jgi:hypothetical protein